MPDTRHFFNTGEVAKNCPDNRQLYVKETVGIVRMLATMGEKDWYGVLPW